MKEPLKMILITTTNDSMPTDFLLVAQNTETYKLLGLSSTGTPYNYDTDHLEFDGYGRYKPRDGSLPQTELEMRTEFFTLYVARESARLKQVRDSGKEQPITITIDSTEYTFDLDAAAQNNIKFTASDFEAARVEAQLLGWEPVTTIPWVLADDTVIGVVLADLQAVISAGVARGLRLHMEYNAAKVALETLIP
jgi:hypothetical protein